MNIEPVVVGIYGISGSGKSRALSMIRKARPEWRCYEGRELIEKVLWEELGETFEMFNTKADAAKNSIRERAVRLVSQNKGITILAGHASFPALAAGGATCQDDSRQEFDDVVTQADKSTFKLILYLDKPARTIWSQRQKDTENGSKARPNLSLRKIGQWIQFEKSLLSRICKEHGIKFQCVSDEDGQLVDHLVKHVLVTMATEARKESESCLRKEIRGLPKADVFLLIDGDRTLCPVDTGALFFEQEGINGGAALLHSVFQRHPDYSFCAFWEVAMLYERILPSYSHYIQRAEEIGKTRAKPYEEWVDFLSYLPSNAHAIVVTSGIREVFKTVLSCTFGEDQQHLSLLAGNHIGLHPYIVDSDAKRVIVRELRHLHKGCKIVSFGDSAVDISMLEEADCGYVVIDDRGNRSLQEFLRKTVVSGTSDRRLYQLKFSSCRSDIVCGGDFWHTGIRVGSLRNLREELGGGGEAAPSLHKVLEYASSSKSASLLATQSRQSDRIGILLQTVHEEIGRFLAERLLDEFGHFLVQKQDFPHVQGTHFVGVTCNKSKVLIVALMRGGEPMARGVYKLFPSARFFHYSEDMPDKEKEALSDHLGSVADVVIVDSVINEGNSIRRVLGLIETLTLPPSGKNRVYVLTGVIQEKASKTLPNEWPRVRFLALRVSENQFKGQGGTDTGNRLFGTI